MYFAMDLKHNPLKKTDIDAERERREEMLAELMSGTGSSEGAEDEEEFDAKPSEEADPKGLVSFLYRVSESCRKAPPEFRFAPSTLRNFVPPGAAHEAAAGHALSEPSGNYTADRIAGFSATSAIL